METDKKLHYEIHSYSSYSTSYLPENIREDSPSNQSSRWSSSSNNPPQYLILKLQRPAIVRSITFGKFEKNHVCNLRKFKVFGGLSEDHMVLLFEGGLRNDSTPETFALRHFTTTDCGDEELIPVIFIQIMPLLSWGTSFNFSIWYVELSGQDDPIFVRSSLRTYNTQREVEIIRLCLKHFRQNGYESAFEVLQKQTNVQLEHPMLTELHTMLVKRGDFSGTEDFIERCCLKQGLMDKWIHRQEYKATWQMQEEVNGTTAVAAARTGQPIRPGMRGGHQLVIDNVQDRIYCFGGWDGSTDLSDLWVFDMRTSSWRLIHEHSEQFDGPSPRSCHKMIFDPKSRQIFTLGRYLDGQSRTKEHIKSEFYLFDTVTETWMEICEDTSEVGGPKLLFDHQMCLDEDQQTVYVFGGRIVSPRNNEELSNNPQYSGLFSYHIATNTWQQILVDCAHPTASQPDVASIKSRVTHSMLFHTGNRHLYIFGGQRNKDYTTDFLSFNVDTQELKTISTESTSQFASGERSTKPQCGFTQRATIDCDRDEIYVLSSLSKEKERRDLNINSLWVYSLKTNTWKCIHRSTYADMPATIVGPPNTTTTTNTTGNTGTSPSIGGTNLVGTPKSSTAVNFPSPAMMAKEPCPRYAHQLVYDAKRRIHYLFGGNPGRLNSPQLRLDDFWVLKLEKPTRGQILRQCKYLIRKLEYEEIARADAMRALQYLQTRLNEIINHDDGKELREFHKLASLLFKPVDAPGDADRLLAVVSPLPLENPSSPDTSSMEGYETSSDSAPVPIPSSSASGSSSAAVRGTLKPPTTGAGGDGVDCSQVEQQIMINSQRCLLYNRLVELMPDQILCQPKGNLSDLVLI